MENKLGREGAACIFKRELLEVSIGNLSNQLYIVPYVTVQAWFVGKCSPGIDCRCVMFSLITYCAFAIISLVKSVFQVTQFVLSSWEILMISSVYHFHIHHLIGAS